MSLENKALTRIQINVLLSYLYR